MKLLSRLFLCIAFILAFSTQLIAEDTPEAAKEKEKPALTAEQIMDKSIEAIGGVAAIEKIKTTVLKGTVEFMGQKLELEAYIKTPDRVMVIQRFPGIGDFIQCINGKTGWANDPVYGLRDLQIEESAAVKFGYLMITDAKWRDSFKSATLVGIEEVGSGKSYVIKLTPVKGSPITNYYDTETFLLTRSIFTVDTPFAKMETDSYLSDWRTIDGVKIAFATTLKSSFGDIMIKITELKNNVQIDDSKFVKPVEGEKPAEPNAPAEKSQQPAEPSK